MQHVLGRCQPPISRRFWAKHSSDHECRVLGQLGGQRLLRLGGVWQKGFVQYHLIEHARQRLAAVSDRRRATRTSSRRRSACMLPNQCFVSVRLFSICLALPSSLVPPYSRNCRCDRFLDVLGHHRAACAEVGVLGRRDTRWSRRVPSGRSQGWHQHFSPRGRMHAGLKWLLRDFHCSTGPSWQSTQHWCPQ